MIKLRRVTAALTALTISLTSGGNSSKPEREPEPSNLGENVAILVLDQFSERSLPSPAGDKNCPYSGLPTNEVGSGGGGDGLPEGISHGEAVFETVMVELAQQGLTPVEPPSSVRHPDVRAVAEWQHSSGNRISVVGVDVADYDTQLMTDNTLAVMNILQTGSLRTTKFVLNMSFLILPCRLGEWYNANLPNPVPTALEMEQMVQAIIRSLAAVEEVQSLVDLLGAFASNPTLQNLMQPGFVAIRDIVLANLVMAHLFKAGQPKGPKYDEVYGADPWNLFLQTERTRVRVIPVGAAGNGVFPPAATGAAADRETFDFPFPPALWNSVVSVSATDNASDTTDYSNSGEVMMTASNPHLADGTSFAAPHLSALAALYLINGGATSCDSHVPVLGYANVDRLSDPSALGRANVDNEPEPSMMWEDLWLDTGKGSSLVTGAATDKCKTFARLAN